MIMGTPQRSIFRYFRFDLIPISNTDVSAWKRHTNKNNARDVSATKKGRAGILSCAFLLLCGHCCCSNYTGCSKLRRLFRHPVYACRKTTGLDILGRTASSSSRWEVVWDQRPSMNTKFEAAPCRRWAPRLPWSDRPLSLYVPRREKTLTPNGRDDNGDRHNMELRVGNCYPLNNRPASIAPRPPGGRDHPSWSLRLFVRRP